MWSTGTVGRSKNRGGGWGGTSSNHTNQGAVAVVQGDLVKRHLALGEGDLRGGLVQLGMPGHSPLNTELSELELILLEMVSCRRNRMCKGAGTVGHKAEQYSWRGEHEDNPESGKVHFGTSFLLSHRRHENGWGRRE